jgi:hypothetical protein
VLVLIACSGGDTEGDGFFTPQIQEPFTVTLATEGSVAFDLEMGATVAAQGQTADGTAYLLEIPAEAYWGGTQAGTMVPVQSVSGLPSGLEFVNGFHFSPDGVRFAPDGQLTITLPSAIAKEDLHVVHYTADPVGEAGQTEAFEARLQPTRLESGGDIVLSMSGFSGVLLLRGDEVACGRVQDADTCSDLDEIIACNIPLLEQVGLNDLQSETVRTVNSLLWSWMDLGLDELAAEPGQLSEPLMLELVAREVACWLGTAQLFNANARTEFSDLLDRLSALLQPAIVDQLRQINEECVALADDETTACVGKGNLFNQHLPLLQIAELFSGLDLIALPPALSINEFCEGVTDGYAAGPGGVHIDGTYTDIGNGVKISPGTALTILPHGYDVFGQDMELAFGKDVTMTERDDPQNALRVEGNLIIGNGWTPSDPSDILRIGHVDVYFRGECDFWTQRIAVEQIQ